LVPKGNVKMKSQRGVRLPTAPPTRKHGDENRYRRNREKAQNWRDYLDATIDDLQEEIEMQEYEAQEMLDELADKLAEKHEEMTEQRGEREPVDDEGRWDDDGGAQAVAQHIEEEVSEGV